MLIRDQVNKERYIEIDFLCLLNDYYRCENMEHKDYVYITMDFVVEDGWGVTEICPYKKSLLKFEYFLSRYINDNKPYFSFKCKNSYQDYCFKFDLEKNNESYNLTLDVIDPNEIIEGINFKVVINKKELLSILNEIKVINDLYRED